MRGPDGNEFPNRGVHLEVVKSERRVFTDAFTKAWEPSEKTFMTVALTFEDQGGKTKYTARVHHWSADREVHEKMGWVSIKAGRSARSSSRRLSKNASASIEKRKATMNYVDGFVIAVPRPIARSTASTPRRPLRSSKSTVHMWRYIEEIREPGLDANPNDYR
jgi:Activator of Hsp90 ATPase homolog 1-like protein